MDDSASVLSRTWRYLIRSAGVLAAGNVTSRLFGLLREVLKSQYFGAGGSVDAFTVASDVPTLLYDLLIRGFVESALVPVFSEYTGEALAPLYSASLTTACILFG